jgi:hypothetical protein
MGFRIDAMLGHVGGPNPVIAEVVIWPANESDDDRLLIVVVDRTLKKLEV